MTVQTNIKALVEAGWSQHRIAKETGISQPSVNRILGGRQRDVLYAQGKRLELIAASLRKTRLAPNSTNTNTKKPVFALPEVGAGNTATKKRKKPALLT